MSTEANVPEKVEVIEDDSRSVVTRTVWYKRIQYPAVKGQLFSLEAALREAHAKAPHWKDRKLKWRETPPEILVMKHFDLLDVGVSGRLSLYEKTAVEVGDLDESAQDIKTEFMLPKGPNRQVCSGTLHFFVHGNNVILVASQSLNKDAFAEFINRWLKSDEMNLMPEGVSIGLGDVIPSKARAELSKVKRVEIRTAITAEVVDSEAEQPGIQVGLAGVLAESAGLLAGLRSPGGLSLKRAVQRRPLHATLVLARKGRPKKADADDFLDTIALAVRYQDQVPFVIRYGKTGKLTNADVSISHQLVLQAKYGHPQYAHTVKRMLEWYHEKLGSGEIPPEQDFQQ